MFRQFLIWLFTIAMPTVPVLADSAASKLLKKDNAWFASQEGQETLENILSWQTEFGDWPKNTDTTKHKDLADSKKLVGTFDNSATTGELRVLARAFRLTTDERYRQAFLRGVDHILQAQYANGGWPQYYPLSKGYPRHITLNDGTMIRLMELLRDVSADSDFAFVDQSRRDASAAAVDRGVDCLIKCQVIVDGVPTVWCAQHDADTLTPTQARTYEHPSLSGAESAGVLKFLMSIKHPSPEVILCVKAGVAWYESSKIEGFRYQRSKSETALLKDSAAPALWARFYEIHSNRPIFSDRDGEIKYDIDEIGSERRNGYTWYGNWGGSVQQKYAKWPYR